MCDNVWWPDERKTRLRGAILENKKMWPCFWPSVALSLALVPGDECEHLEYVFNDQVLGQGFPG